MENDYVIPFFACFFLNMLLICIIEKIPAHFTAKD